MSAEVEAPLDVLGQGNLILSSDTHGCNRKCSPTASLVLIYCFKQDRICRECEEKSKMTRTYYKIKVLMRNQILNKCAKL